jgi:hypothetical protein
LDDWDIGKGGGLLSFENEIIIPEFFQGVLARLGYWEGGGLDF